MESNSNKSKNKEINRGAWTAEEDEKLAEAIEIHGPKKWTLIATKAGIYDYKTLRHTCKYVTSYM